MNRINKALIALALLGNFPILSSEGLYIGISTGTSYAQADINKITRKHLKYSLDTGKSGTTIGAFFGYNHLIQKTPLFIGIEGGINHANLKMGLSQDHGILFQETMTANTNYSLNAVLKFGVVINDLMIYGKGGAFKSQWRLCFEGRHPNDQTFSKLVKTNSYGSVYGFGADYKLNEHWGLGIDHTINTCQTLDYKLPTGSANVSPKINTTSLRLTYTF